MKKLRNALYFLLLLLAVGCGNETEVGETPEKPVPGASPDRHEIVLELQNKLTLPRAVTRADGSIAEADENAIGSLDIYAFGCATEEGQYTLLDRFAYRSEGGQPPGTEPLTLTIDPEAGRMQARFYPRKGLYTRFYCIANATRLNDDTGAEYTNFHRMALGDISTDQALPGVAIVAPGTPTENTFLSLVPPLMRAKVPDDILRTPLVMSAASLLALDLRNPRPGIALRLNMRLTRTVARFDIINNATLSHLTITSVGMARGRAGVSLFPILPMEQGDASLITYAQRPFDRPTANQGLATKAFYCYPSPRKDDAALIIQGTYALNQTDTPKEVSYLIPFEQVSGGSSMRIEINQNHRYTLQITKADAFKLTHNIKIEDWSDSGELGDITVDNTLDPVLVRDLQPAAKTLYDPLTGTVTLGIDPTNENSFTVHTASNAGVEGVLNYVMAEPGQYWLNLEEMMPDPDYTHKGAKAVKYKISLSPDYRGDSYPTAVLRLGDLAGKSEETVIIKPEPYPLPFPTTPKPGAAGGKLNLFDETQKILHLYRVTGSSVMLKLVCPDGVTVATDLDDWLDIKRTGGVDTAPLYTLTLKKREVVLPGDEATLKFYNAIDPTLKLSVRLVLHEAEITDLNISDHAGLSNLSKDIQTVSMTVTKSSAFRLAVRAYDEVKVQKVEYAIAPGETQVDQWLEYTQTSTRGELPTVIGTLEERMQTTALYGKVAATRGVVVLPDKQFGYFTFSMKPTAQHFGPATVTLKNTCLGPDLILHVNPDYPTPVITAATPMTPTLNNYDAISKTLWLMQQQVGKSSVATLSVYSPGGSTLTPPAGITVTPTFSLLPTQVYTLTWVGSDDKLSDRDLTLTVANRSNATKSQPVTIKAIATGITGLILTPKTAESAALNTNEKDITINAVEANSFTLKTNTYGGRVTVKKCPSFLTPPVVTRGLPGVEETNLLFTIKADAINAKSAETLVLIDPAGGPDRTLNVTPIYQAPIVQSAGAMVPVNANDWNDAESTLYLVQVISGQSTGILNIYSLGGSTLTLPAGITASLLTSDDKLQSYQLRWAASTATNLTEQILKMTFKNKSDETKTKEVKVKLMPNLLTDLAITPKASGTATLAGTTVTTDITNGNWFKLTLKAFGKNTRVTVKNKPAWLTAAAPAVSRGVPAKEQTAITFTVDATKTDFTEADIVLTNPSGGPELTIRVKPKYMKPTLNTPKTLSSNSSWAGGYLNLVQARTGNATGTLPIYSLGGGRGQIMTALGGLSMGQTALAVNTDRDYLVNWAANNNGLNDQTTTLRVFNKDDSQYLDIPIRLVANGCIDIYNSKHNADRWDIAATKTGLAFTAATLDFPISKSQVYEIHVNTYGGADVVACPAWLTYTQFLESPAITTPYPTKVNTRYSFVLQEQAGAYPQGNVTFRPTMGGPDFNVTLRPAYQAPTVAAGAMNPTGVNNYDAGQSFVYLVQAKQGVNSTAVLAVNCRGGSTVTTSPTYNGFSISPANSTAIDQSYTLTWAGNNNLLTANQNITLTFANNSDNSKTKTVTATLMPNSLMPTLTAQNGGIDLSAVTASTAALTMPIIKDRQFTLSMNHYGGNITAKSVPGWLQLVANTRAAPGRPANTFTYRLIENAVNFNDTQLVFANPTGGPDMTITINRQFQAPTVTGYTNGGTPSVNSFSGNTVNVYRTKAATTTTHLISVYSLGGSDIETTGSTDPGWFTRSTEGNSGNNHTKYYRVGHNNTQTVGGYNSGHDGVFYARNAADISKKATLNIHFIASRPSLGSTPNGALRWNGVTDTSASFDVMPHSDLYGKYGGLYFTIHSPAGVTPSVNAFGPYSMTENHPWTAAQPYNQYEITIPGLPWFSGQVASMGTLTFTSKDPSYFYDYTFSLYNYFPVAKGYWPQYYDNNTGKYWINTGSTQMTPQAAIDGMGNYPGWRLPTMAEYRAFTGWTKQGLFANFDNEDWNPVNASYRSNVFLNIFDSPDRMKVFSNEAGRRFDIHNNNNQAGYDIGGYDTSAPRYLILVSP